MNDYHIENAQKARRKPKTNCPSCGAPYEVLEGFSVCSERCHNKRHSRKRKAIKAFPLLPNFTELKRIEQEMQ